MTNLQQFIDFVFKKKKNVTNKIFNKKIESEILLLSGGDT